MLGDKCSYLDQEPVHIPSCKLVRTMSTPQVRDSLKYTRICKYWSSNRCKLGQDCNFAHSEHELRDQPDLVGTRLCFQFSSKGRCKNGDNCKFAHGKDKLRSLPKTRRREMEPMKILVGNLSLSGLTVCDRDASPQKIAEVLPLKAPPGLAPPPGLSLPGTACSTAIPSPAVSAASTPRCP